MGSNYSLKNGSFIINDYNNTYPFSNFLPGIAGVWGVPIWVFYVNRAQAIAGFGISDKDHSIGEFFPANKAYSFVSYFGFRTFLKINKKVQYEPFSILPQCNSGREHEMTVNSASLEIKEVNHELGLIFSVKYFTLPNAPVGGLIREFSVKNISNKEVNLEFLDGLSRLIPFGSTDLFLKYLARTLEAWMHSYIINNFAIFRLIVSPQDVSQTKYIDGANFNYAFYEDRGRKVHPYIIVDPEVVFAQNTSYSYPQGFFKEGFKVPLSQVDCGKTPCSFSHFNWSLSPDEEKPFYSIFGSSFKEELIKNFVSTIDAGFIKKKEKDNEEIIEEIKNNAMCVSGHKEFDQYVKSSYLDNVLRGGYPYNFEGKGIYTAGDKKLYKGYYIFSRKHGDLERDYNKFKLLPSYFSEGEGNYRDINQNRRMDLFFNPFIGAKNINYFLNLIKIDGYNPLVVKGEKLFFAEKEARSILKEFEIKDEKLFSLMVNGCYLGEFFKLMEEEGITVENKAGLAKKLVEIADREAAADFGEGYWIDHWRYNLDLIENYLYFYPDKFKELFLHKDYMFWDDEHRVKDRRRRYYLEGGKVYQWHSVEVDEPKKAVVDKRRSHKNFLRTKNGRIYKTNLTAKFLTFILNKAAAMDPDGIGVEMEADKPGWCDSLNGLPALFGSSLCETLELKRACLFLLDSIGLLSKEGLREAAIAVEIITFLNRLDKLLSKYFTAAQDVRDYMWWEKSGCIKEEFQKQTFLEIEGRELRLGIEKLEKFLKKLIKKLNIGIEKAKDKNSKVHFTYFIYEVEKYSLRKKSVVPLKFKRKPLPLFLEGSVHVLRVEKDKQEYYFLKESELFDKELKMYRLNASLKDQPLEIGRSRIFVPGWLENESVWLHMEYKYLLEVLKNGLYEEFFKDFKNCCVCFFEPQRYGRNILENSSFIVSSAYPDKNLWGKGFVARLSGATVELLNIWIYLCLGSRPFIMDKESKLNIKFAPILKGEMFTLQSRNINFKGKDIIIEANSFVFKLFSSMLVVYHNPQRKDTFKESCRISEISVEIQGKKQIFNSDTIPAPLSYEIRETHVDRIDVYLE